MNTGSKTQRSRIAIVSIFLLTAGLGCLCLPGGIIPKIPSNQVPSPTPPPDTQIPPVTNGALNAKGPWLLMETDQGLWAANPDGSGLKQITDVDYWQGDIQKAVQPSGNGVVFISPGGNDLHNMALNLATLPDGKITKITDLTSAQTEAFASSGGPVVPGFEALRAVGEQLSYAWSPEGTQLAFAGVMDGPSADIYLYNATTQKVSRVSQDDAQDFLPSWSPDGKHLLYPAAVGFGTGAWMTMSGVWSADGNGNNVTQLYKSTSSGEEILGWLDNTTAVMDTWSPLCGRSLLRLYDVVSKQQSMLNKDCVISASVNSLRGEALFATTSGQYLLKADNRKPVLVGHDLATRIELWRSYKDLFIVKLKDGGVDTVGSGEMDRQSSPVKAPSESLDVAEYGAIWGWTSKDGSQPGVWISGPGMDIGQIFKNKAHLPIWDSQNNLLFFTPKDGGGESIYRATFNANYKDLSVAASINTDVHFLAWMGGH